MHEDEGMDDDDHEEDDTWVGVTHTKGGLEDGRWGVFKETKYGCPSAIFSLFGDVFF